MGPRTLTGGRVPDGPSSNGDASTTARDGGGAATAAEPASPPTAIDDDGSVSSGSDGEYATFFDSGLSSDDDSSDPHLDDSTGGEAAADTDATAAFVAGLRKARDDAALEASGVQGCAGDPSWGREVYGTCALVVTAESPDELSTDTRAVFTHEVRCPHPPRPRPRLVAIY